MISRGMLTSVSPMEKTRYASSGIFNLLMGLSVITLSTAAMSAQDMNIDVQKAPVQAGKLRPGDVFDPAVTLGVKNPEKCPPRKEGGEGGDWSGSKCTYPKPDGGSCKDLGDDCTEIPNFNQCSCDEADDKDDPKGGGISSPGEVQTPDNF